MTAPRSKEAPDLESLARRELEVMDLEADALSDLRESEGLATGQLAEWDLPAPFVIERTVGAEQIDEYGHTNNTVYSVWCEQVAWEHSRAVGLDIADYRRLNRAMALRRSEMHFLAPCHEGDRVLIANWIVVGDGRVQAYRRYQMVLAATGATLARALQQWACIDLQNGRPRRMPPEFAERYVVELEVAKALQETESPFAMS